MSVTAAQGFTATGLHCGIKTEGAFDLAVIRATSVASATAVFTSSSTAAPAVHQGRGAVEDGRLRLIVAASGCANAGTGLAGTEAVQRVVEKAATIFDVNASEVLVSTTGPIGPVLPDDLVHSGMAEAAQQLRADAAGGTAAAQGILTTDSVSKESARQIDGFVIGGMAKGSGMIRPDMATMLAYLTTDAAVDPDLLRDALRSAVDVTFNCLNIDGCQSTNDTVVLMASGESGVTPDPATFEIHLTEVCRDLVAQMASDAEGASRVVTIYISGAVDDGTAREIGKAIADASIVRASFYGGDSNWGRLLAAAGAAGQGITAGDIAVRYEGIEVASRGIGVDHDQEELLSVLEVGDFAVEMDVGRGPGTATIVTTDLTPEYVIFNGERT